MESVNLEVLCTLTVLLMLLGLQMIEAGSVRSKNVSSVFMRGLASLTICIICSWLTGFMFTHSAGHYLLGYDPDYLILHNVTAEDRSRWLLYTAISTHVATVSLTGDCHSTFSTLSPINRSKNRTE